MSRNILFTHFPVLESPRLMLRQLRLSDVPNLYALYNAAETQAYQSQHLYTTAELTRYILSQNEAFRDRSKIMWAMVKKDDQSFVGTRVLYADDDSGFVEIQGDTLKTYWRQGYTKEAYITILRHLQKCGMYGVYGKVQKENVNAMSLMRSLNFTPVKEYVSDNGIDFVSFAIRLR